MYYEFYIDQFFAEQLLSDYLLLAAAVRMLGIKVSGKRLAAGSVAGAVLVTVLTCIQLADWQMIGMLGAGAVVFRGRNGKNF